MNKLRFIGITAYLLCSNFPNFAYAHVSEQALVLLLPTEAYILGGCLAVIASILAVSVVPHSLVIKLFQPISVNSPFRGNLYADALSLMSFVLLVISIYIGFNGSTDPLRNFLPLLIWTGWWILIVSLSGIICDFWRVFNPWTGLYHLFNWRRSPKPLLKLSESIGVLPAIILFVNFSIFFIADPAPSYPNRLAWVVSVYWLFSFIGLVIFGEKAWMERCEPFSIFFRQISTVALLKFDKKWTFGFPGWNLATNSNLWISLGVFAVIILAVGSFDGLKETFWWLALIGINPLEFPGRTSVIWSSSLGLIAGIFILFCVFLSALWFSAYFVNMYNKKNTQISVKTLFCYFAPALIPIVLGYHISHFLISLLVDGQYLLVSIGDPFANGRNFFGLHDISITTGFLKNTYSVKIIWTTQVFMVVFGHVLSVLVLHRIALNLFNDQKLLIISQLPISLLMIMYTWFGLWLLATPRGI